MGAQPGRWADCGLLPVASQPPDTLHTHETDPSGPFPCQAPSAAWSASCASPTTALPRSTRCATSRSSARTSSRRAARGPRRCARCWRAWTPAASRATRSRWAAGCWQGQLGRSAGARPPEQLRCTRRVARARRHAGRWCVQGAHMRRPRPCVHRAHLQAGRAAPHPALPTPQPQVAYLRGKLAPLAGAPPAAGPPVPTPVAAPAAAPASTPVPGSVNLAVSASLQIAVEDDAVGPAIFALCYEPAGQQLVVGGQGVFMSVINAQGATVVQCVACERPGGRAGSRAGPRGCPWGARGWPSRA